MPANPSGDSPAGARALLIIPHVKLSRKRHIPIFYIKGTPPELSLDGEWYPYQVTRLLSQVVKATHWKRLDDDHWEYKPFHMKFYRYYACLLNELPQWKKYYSILPARGKVVLDVGAGCGETAYFYFKRGALKVICVEPNRFAVECLRENAKRNHWSVEILEQPFSLEMLDTLQFDCMKMDCEDGCEAQLLNYGKPLPPSIIEVHDSSTLTKFQAKFEPEFRLLREPQRSVSIIAVGNFVRGYR